MDERSKQEPLAVVSKGRLTIPALRAISNATAIAASYNLTCVSELIRELSCMLVQVPSIDFLAVDELGGKSERDVMAFATSTLLRGLQLDTCLICLDHEVVDKS